MDDQDNNNDIDWTEEDEAEQIMANLKAKKQYAAKLIDEMYADYGYYEDLDEDNDDDEDNTIEKITNKIKIQ